MVHANFNEMHLVYLNINTNQQSYIVVFKIVQIYVSIKPTCWKYQSFAADSTPSLD